MTDDLTTDQLPAVAPETASGARAGDDQHYRKGPVTLRGALRPRRTTDQKLLESTGPADWVHTDPWRVLRIQSEFVEGFGALAELGPAISIFGSARTAPTDPNYALAEEIGLLLDEGVVAAPEDVDLCMILGAGWPLHLGGITPYLDAVGASERVNGRRFHTS